MELGAGKDGGVVTIYGIVCIASGRSYVGQAKNLGDRIKGHAAKPPMGMLPDLQPYVKGGGQTREQWFRSQVEIRVLASGAWSKMAASREEARFIAMQPTGYNKVKLGSPGKCRQGFAIMASIRKRKFKG